MEENTMKKLEAYFGLCGYAVAALAFSKARAWFIYLRS